MGYSWPQHNSPLFLLEFKTVSSIKSHGFRKIFLFSYLSLASLCLIAAAFSSPAVILIAVLAGSLALSFLEPISQIFFFSLVNNLEEEKAQPVFFTSSSLGPIVMRLLAGLAISISGYGAMFLVASLAMLLVAGVASKINDSQ